MKASSILSTLVMAYLVGSAPTPFNSQQIQAVQPNANQQTLQAGKVENNPVIQTLGVSTKHYDEGEGKAVEKEGKAVEGEGKAVEGALKEVKGVAGEGKPSKQYMNPYMMGMYGGMGMMGMMNPYMYGMGY
jgi:hypothetical protein